MSRYLDIEPHVSGLRQFAQALTLRRSDTKQSAASRTDWLVQRCVTSALTESGEGPGANVRQLLYIAAVQHHRANLRQDKLALTREPTGGAQFAAAREEAAALPDEVRSTFRALAQLPVESREVLLLVVLAKMSYVEVAQILSLPLADVLTRLTRARLSFGSLLGQREPEDAEALPHRARGFVASKRAAAGHLRLVK